MIKIEGLKTRRREEDNGKPQNPYYRDFPFFFIREALKIFKERNGKLIIEIGSMRKKMDHSIKELYTDCCMDGHSSLFLAKTCDEFYSIDINKDCTDLTNRELYRFGLFNYNKKAICKDGLEFLKNFNKQIDLLFLDAWDVDLEDSEEKHLEAYKISKDKLHKNSLILIDDTDVERNEEGIVIFSSTDNSGKGKLVIPEAIKDGWKVLFTGRQTLLSRR